MKLNIGKNVLIKIFDCTESLQLHYAVKKNVLSYHSLSLSLSLLFYYLLVSRYMYITRFLIMILKLLVRGTNAARSVEHVNLIENPRDTFQ